MLDRDQKQYAGVSRGDCGLYGRLSAQLSCGDDCRVTGPAGYGLNSLRRWASRDPWCVLVLGAGAANGASALRWLLRRWSKGATLTTVINDGYGDADNALGVNRGDWCWRAAGCRCPEDAGSGWKRLPLLTQRLSQQ
jgi:hypothetical protein